MHVEWGIRPEDFSWFAPKVALSIATYEDLRDQGKTVVDIVEKTLMWIIEPIGKQLIIDWLPSEGWTNRRYKFNQKNWNLFQRRLLAGDLRLFVLSHFEPIESRYPDPGHVSIGLGVFMPESGRAEVSEVQLVVEQVYVGDELSPETQEKWVSLAQSAFTNLNGATGYITIDYFPEPARREASPLEYALKDLRLKDHLRKLSERVRGYYWGNFLSSDHIAQLGGVVTIKTEAPCFSVQNLSNRDADRVYLQLTPRLHNTPPDALRALRDYLHPLLPLGSFHDFSTRPRPLGLVD